MTDLRSEAEAMIARLRKPTNVCGACGQPWTGEKCEQADNSWGFPTCYPHNEINLDNAADIITKLLSAWGGATERAENAEAALREALDAADELDAKLTAATERADHAEGFCYRAAMAADKDGFVCAEAVALRAELAAAREALAQEREALEMAEALLSRPLTRDLETGFRHSPLTNAERDKRYAETCKFALEHVQAAIRARKEPTP